MNEHLVEKIAKYVEYQCANLTVSGHCSITGCKDHWLAAQIRARKFEEVQAPRVRAVTPEPRGMDIRNIVEDRAKADPNGGR